MDKTIEMSFDNNESNKTFCTENARRAFIILHLSSLFCDSGCLSICLSVFVSAVLSSICLPTSVCLLMLLLPRTHYCSKCTFDSILLVCLSVRLSLCLLFICACFLSVFFSLCCFVCLPDCLCVWCNVCVTVCLFVGLPVYPSIFVSTVQSAWPSVGRSDCLSVCVCGCLVSFCLSRAY